MKSSNLVVVKHNDVVEAGYQLSIYESRVLLTCIAQIDSMKPLTMNDKFEVSVNDVADLAKVNHKNAYKALNAAIERLAQRWVVIDTPSKEVKKLRTRWISGIRYMNQEGVIQLTFAGDMLPYLSQLSREFTKYRLENVLKFKSTYSIRIYELLCKWSGDEKVLTVDWIKEYFQLVDKYDRIGNLKSKVIDVAIEEINAHSDMWVKYEQVKRGRSVVGFKFLFGLKDVLKKKKASKSSGQIHGVSKAVIDKLARTGESYEKAALRIAKLRKILNEEE